MVVKSIGSTINDYDPDSENNFPSINYFSHIFKPNQLAQPSMIMIMIVKPVCSTMNCLFMFVKLIRSTMNCFSIMVVKLSTNDSDAVADE